METMGWLPYAVWLDWGLCIILVSTENEMMGEKVSESKKIRKARSKVISKHLLPLFFEKWESLVVALRAYSWFCSKG